MKMCQAFAQNGHEVHLMLNEDGSSADADALCNAYGVGKCVELVRVPRGIHSIPKIRYYLSTLRVRRLMRSISPDLLYFRQIPECYFQLGMGTKFIFEIHQVSGDFTLTSQWMLKKISESDRLFRFVVITEPLRDHYIGRFPWLKQKIIVVPDGADLVEIPAAVDGFPRDDGRMQVGYVGHLYQGKGMELISRIAPRCPWADFHIVGGMEADIRHWKGVMAASENLRFHGFVPQSQIPGWLATFDVCLLPNQRVVRIFGANDGVDIGAYTSPLKMFEYMSAGKPIIASDLPVLREVLEHDRTAILCPPEDVSSWITALQQLRDDGTLRRRLGIAARTVFAENYTWKRRAQRVLDAEVS